MFQGRLPGDLKLPHGCYNVVTKWHGSAAHCLSSAHRPQHR